MQPQFNSEIAMLIFMEHGMHMSLDELKREVTRWRQRWLLVEGGIPQTLVETLDFANPELYTGIYAAVKTLCRMRGCPRYP